MGGYPSEHNKGVGLKWDCKATSTFDDEHFLNLFFMESCFFSLPLKQYV